MIPTGQGKLWVFQLKICEYLQSKTDSHESRCNHRIPDGNFPWSDLPLSNSTNIPGTKCRKYTATTSQVLSLKE